MLCFIFLTVTAEAKITAIPEIVVEGEKILEEKENVSIRSESLPSAVYVITREDIEKMPVQHPLDLFRRIPGMITSHLGQGDVADGFGMRGYQSGHGSQIAIYVDGVPINVPHHSHSHGFADIGWIVPEMIERIEIIKGPFSPLYGNFALGGVVNIITKKSHPSPEMGAEAGSYEAFRGVATISESSWEFTPLRIKPLLIYEAYTKEGFRDNSEYTRYNAFNKITMPLLDGSVSIRAHYVDRDWGAPGYLPVSQVKSGFRNRTDAVNPKDGGDSEYMNLVLNYTPKGGEAGFHGTLYAASEDINRYSTFPPSPQRLEHNDRDYMGWNLLYHFMPARTLSIIVGTDGRYDAGNRRRYTTEDREIIDKVQDWHIEEVSTGFFGQAQYKPFEFVKLVGGIRYDLFSFDIENHIRPQNSGDGDTSIFSPKAGIVITPLKDFNIFANKGLGFRTPSAEEMSPHDRNYKNFHLKPAKVDTWDIGFETLLLEKIGLIFDFYKTDMEREIRVIGSEAVNVGESRRNGYEMELTFYASPGLRLYASYGQVKARLKDPATPEENRVRGVPEDYVGAGIQWGTNVHDELRLILDFSYQRLGDTPLDAAGKFMRSPVGRYMGKATCILHKRWTLSLESMYHPSKYVSEGMFLLGGEPAYDPKPVLEVNLGVRYTF